MLIGVQCPRGYVGLEEHYICMTKPDHPCPYTPDVLNAMTEPNLERSGIKYSPSSMLGCLRQKVLSRDHDWFMNVDNAWTMQRGHMAHAYAEQLKPWRGVIGVIREQRFRSSIDTKYGEQFFHGKMDAIILNSIETVQDTTTADMGMGIARTIPVGPPRTILHVSIIDYKSKADIGHGPDTPEYNPRLLPGQAAAQRDHQQQVNLYAWLVRNELPGWLNNQQYVGDGTLQLNEYYSVQFPHIDEVVIDELIIEYMDFHKARRFTSAGSLKAKGKRMPDRKHYEELELLPIFMSSHDYLTRWIRRRIEREIEADTQLPPPLTGDDAAKFCGRCPVRDACYNIAVQEGYDASDQAPR